LVSVVGMETARLDVDLHLLELRFAGARLIEPQAVEKLARDVVIADPSQVCRRARSLQGRAFGGADAPSLTAPARRRGEPAWWCTIVRATSLYAAGTETQTMMQ
jgi:hypothetical protein